MKPASRSGISANKRVSLSHGSMAPQDQRQKASNIVLHSLESDGGDEKYQKMGSPPRSPHSHGHEDDDRPKSQMSPRSALLQNACRSVLHQEGGGWRGSAIPDWRQETVEEEREDRLSPVPRSRVEAWKCWSPRPQSRTVDETTHDLQRAWSRMSNGRGGNDEQVACAICWGLLQTPIRLGCGHECCGACLSRWEENGVDDPMCPACPSALEPHGFEAILKQGLTYALRAEHARASEKAALWDHAAQSLRSAVALCPDDAKALNSLGTVLQRQGDAEGALQMYREALDVDPRCAETHYNRGAMLAAHSDHKAALKAFEDAVTANPRFAKAYNSMGTVLHKLGDLAGAAEAFRKAFEKDPSLLTAVHSLGAVYLAQGDQDSARAAFKTVIDLTKPGTKYT